MHNDETQLLQKTQRHNLRLNKILQFGPLFKGPSHYSLYNTATCRPIQVLEKLNAKSFMTVPETEGRKTYMYFQINRVIKLNLCGKDTLSEIKLMGASVAIDSEKWTKAIHSC